MRKKFSIFNFKFSIKYLLLIIGYLLLNFLLPTTNHQLSNTLAQSLGCQTNNRVEGLISTPTLSGKFGNQISTCVVDPKAVFVPYKLPTYDDLKSLYFDQSKASKKVLTGAVLTSADLDNQKVHFRDGNLDVNAPLSYSVTAVVFVKGYLSINQNITGSTGTGLVLVVRDNVNIQSTVTQIDAVIISQGIIYTAGAGCSSGVSAIQLVVSGSLISLNSGNPIKFCRKLTDNSLPAEKINWQAKYLVILKDLFSDTLQKWGEIQ